MTPEIDVKKQRRFGGKLFVPKLKEGKPEELLANKIEHNFEKKHLKAYIRGDKKFSFGVDITNQPVYYMVKEEWI